MQYRFVPGRRHAILAAAAAVCFYQAPAPGMTIVTTFDSNVQGLSNAAQWETAFTYAAQQFDNLYTNPITVNITLDASSQANFLGSGTPTVASFLSYGNVRTALQTKYANQGTAVDSTASASLPATAPTGSANYVIDTAEGKALGFLAANGSASDGTVSIGTTNSFTFDPNNRAVAGKFDFIGVAEHEISDILGRTPGLGATFGLGQSVYEPYDLFRYSGSPSPVRSMNMTDTGVFFSYDNGATALLGFNGPGNVGALSDWNNDIAGSYNPDSFNAFSAAGYENDISAVDQNVMDVLGYISPIQWNVNTGGSWATSANWLKVGVPNGQGVVVGFAQPGGGTVTLAASTTVGKINFNSSGSYNISGGGNTLTFDDTTDAVNNPSVNLYNGSHTISAPIALANGLNVNMLNGSTLSITNTISGPGAIAVGGMGTLNLSTITVLPSTSSLTVTNGAKVALAACAAPSTPTVQTITSLNFDSGEGSKLDIANNEVIATGTTPATIRADIIGGSIYSSLSNAVYGVGYISSGGGTKIRYTVEGDTNLDGSVNFSDLLTVASDYGMSNANWAQGDFNYDSTVNFSDLLALASNYGTSLTPGNSEGFSPSFTADWNLAVSEVAASVPEPTSIAMLGLGALGLLGRRRRH